MSEVWEKMIDGKRVRTRFANKNDFNEIMGVDHVCAANDSQSVIPAFLRNFLSKNSVLVAVSPGGIIAYLAYFFLRGNSSVCHIANTAVLPHYQNKKIFTALLLLCMKYSGVNNFELKPRAKEGIIERTLIKISKNLGFQFLEVSLFGEPGACALLIPSNISDSEKVEKIESFLGSGECGWRKL